MYQISLWGAVGRGRVGSPCYTSWPGLDPKMDPLNTGITDLPWLYNLSFEILAESQ